MTTGGLARVSISLEDALLENFDAYIDEKGYHTRSEAVRDLIREKLLVTEGDDDSGCVGVLSLVFAQHFEELAARIAARLRTDPGLIVASTQVQIGDDHCLQAIILRGTRGQVRRLGNAMLSIKGVLHGDLQLTGDETQLRKLNRRNRRRKKELAGVTE